LIVRIVRGNVAADQVPVFHDLARRMMPEVRTRDGLVLANVARQTASDGAEEIVFATVWRDMPALYAWIGCSDLFDVPAPIKEFESYFASRDLQYYEVIDTDVPGAMAPEA
jgi:heme-degrading monooxygenase HmoA